MLVGVTKTCLHTRDIVENCHTFSMAAAEEQSATLTGEISYILYLMESRKILNRVNQGGKAGSYRASHHAPINGTPHYLKSTDI